MSVNILLPVKPNAEGAIRQIIDSTEWQAGLESIDTLHFLALALLPQRIGDPTKSYLLVEANFDAQRPQLLTALWRSLPEPFAELLRHCEVVTPSDENEFTAVMQTLDHGEGSAHIALPGMDLHSIRNSVLLYQAVQSAADAIEDSSLNASGICGLIAQDTRVQNAIFETPELWPGESIRGAMPYIAFAFSLVLTLCLLSTTGLQPLSTGDYLLPQVVFLNITLSLAILLLFIKANGVKRLYRFGALITIFLIVTQFFFLEIPTLPLYSAAIAGILIATLVRVLNRVPPTSSIEIFIIPIVMTGYGFVLALFALRVLGTPNLALAADVWIVLIVFAGLVYLAKVPLIPLEVIDAKAILLGLLLYILLPVPVNGILQSLALVVVLILFTITCTLSVMQCLLQRQESRDFEYPPVWEAGPVRNAITAFEAGRSNSHNHLISLTEVKPGFLRWFAIRIVLLNVILLAKLQGTRGELSGIVTIHFARWLLISKAQPQLLFSSNYCGSWGSYLDEFINNASGGLTSIWSNTVGFPRSAWLKEGGAALAERFKLFARRSQVPTLYHYSAYPALTVDQIEKYLRLNQLIAKEQRSTEECEELLRML